MKSVKRYLAVPYYELSLRDRAGGYRRVHRTQAHNRRSRHRNRQPPSESSCRLSPASPRAVTVNETVCTPLAAQWEKYAKKNGLVNANGEPVVRLHCEAVDNPAPVPQPQ